MSAIQIWYNGPFGAEFKWSHIERKDCVPSKLVKLACSLNCLFITAPFKYGCRQFCNVNKLKK